MARTKPSAAHSVGNIGTTATLQNVFWRKFQYGSCSSEELVQMMEEYADLPTHHDKHGNYPIHIECSNLCRSLVIAKCMELFPESLAKMNTEGMLPLHRILWNNAVAIEEDILVMIEKYPAAFRYENIGCVPPPHF
jgi:hypothetical protein